MRGEVGLVRPLQVVTAALFPQSQRAFLNPGGSGSDFFRMPAFVSAGTSAFRTNISICVGATDPCLRIVVKAAIGEEKQAGILARDLAGVRQYLEQGFTHLAIDSDLSLLRNAYRQVLSSVKQETLLG
jgi:hypothetical protein